MYKYTNRDLLKMPQTYQFSDVSDENFLEYYIQQRKIFLDKLVIDKELTILLESYQYMDKQEILKFQKRFEVKKTIFNNYKKDIEFLPFLSFCFVKTLEKQFCYSIYSTFLKINDTLTSVNYEHSPINKLFLFYVVKRELEFYEGLNKG